MLSDSPLLHAERLARVPFFGWHIQRIAEKRVRELVRAAGDARDPDLTVLIRTRNDGARLESLFEDFAAQVFTGHVQIVVVDTESRDDTVAIARRHHATVISLKQSEFSYPRALNEGFRAAKYPWVLTLVGHSNLGSRYTFKVATRYAGEPKFGGAFSFGLFPDVTASMAERLLGSPFALRHLRRRAAPAVKPRMGLLAANDSLVSKAAWQKLGGYDERFAAGGEDAELGRQMLAHGLRVYWEPALSLYHSHGLSLVNMWRQFGEWRRLSRPQHFEHERLKRYGRDFS